MLWLNEPYNDYIVVRTIIRSWKAESLAVPHTVVICRNVSLMLLPPGASSLNVWRESKLAFLDYPFFFFWHKSLSACLEEKQQSRLYSIPNRYDWYFFVMNSRGCFSFRGFSDEWCPTSKHQVVSFFSFWQFEHKPTYLCFFCLYANLKPRNQLTGLKSDVQCDWKTVGIRAVGGMITDLIQTACGLKWRHQFLTCLSG